MRLFQPNDMLLVKNAGYVRRACLISCGEQAAEVLLVDYGSKLRCSISQLRVAPANIVAPRFLVSTFFMHSYIGLINIFF